MLPVIPVPLNKRYNDVKSFISKNYDPSKRENLSAIFSTRTQNKMKTQMHSEPTLTLMNFRERHF